MQAGFWDTLRDLLLWIPLKIWELLLDGLATVIEAIPVPGFLDQADGLFGGLPAGVVYFTDALQLEVGIGFMVSAYVIRFLIRRIPVIG